MAWFISFDHVISTVAEQRIIQHLPKISVPSTGLGLESVLLMTSRIKLNAIEPFKSALAKPSAVQTVWTAVHRPLGGKDLQRTNVGLQKCKLGKSSALCTTVQPVYTQTTPACRDVAYWVKSTSDNLRAFSTWISKKIQQIFAWKITSYSSSNCHLNRSWIIVWVTEAQCQRSVDTFINPTTIRHLFEIFLLLHSVM